MDCDEGGLEEPGGVLVLEDDLPLAQETLESGWDNHTPSASARRLTADFYFGTMIELHFHFYMAVSTLSKQAHQVGFIF